MTLFHNMKFIDFHTHASGCEKYIGDSSVIAVQSLHMDEIIHPRADYATLGVHPMLLGASEKVGELRNNSKTVIEDWADKILNSPTPIIAIGECGWDTRSALSLSEQNILIDFHLELAALLHLPIVFHVVGGWHHLLKRHSKATTPWIVHGFRGKPQLAQQLIDADIYLSLHPLSPTPQTQNYFLETDESSSHIKSLYASRGVDREEKFNLFSNLFLL